MKAKHCIIAAYFLGSITLQAQTNEIKQWSDAHPAVLFIESEDATDIYLENLAAKNIPYIIFNQEITLTDIANFESIHYPVNLDELHPSAAMEIKLWIAKHPDVKIIKRSVYNQLDTSKQSTYESLGALILIGEEITLEDISNFE